MGGVSKLNTEYLLQGLDELHYTAINLGVRDFINGGKFLNTLHEKKKFQFLAGNVYYKDTNKSFARPFIIRNVKADKDRGKKLPYNSLKVGIIGLCEERATLFRDNIKEPMLVSRAPASIAKKLVDKVRKKADVIILLYYGKYNQLQPIISDAKGIDVVVVGGEYYRVERTETTNPIIVSTPSMGKYAGVLTLQLDEKKNIISSHKERLPLNENIIDDAHFVKLVADYENAAQELRKEQYEKMNKSK